MLYSVFRFVGLVFLATALGCGPRMTNVETAALKPRYVAPTPPQRATLPLVLVYDPRELPDEVQLSVPSGFPSSKLLGARALVTSHLKSGLEAFFEHVSVVDDASKVPADTLTGTVRFVDVGLALSASGQTMVGTIEWSLTLKRPGEQQVLYSWGERTVGTREGAGSFGRLDPEVQVQGAIEASLRSLLKDMDTKGVVNHLL